MYSPVAKLSSFQLILAIAACNNWEIETFNFVGAYLNGKLDENKEIYMHSPLGYNSDPNPVKHLFKLLYGLKQARCKWYDALVHALVGLNFSKMHADPGVFVAHIGEDILILLCHIDDCMLTGSSKQLIALYKRKLNACHMLTDLGLIS
jgi:hypothetical protein